MNFKIYIVGRKIDKTYLEGIKEYEKRLSRYCKTTLQYFKNEELLLKKLSDKSYKISISIHGKMISSEQLSEKINHLGIQGQSDLTFIIGSENTSFDDKISISPMEMDIGMKTMIMYEQIYRAYRILNNEPYHK